MRSIDRVRDAYGRVVARLVRIAIISVPIVGVAAVAIYGLGKVTPTGFLPEDDQGAFFIVLQLPDGASVGRTLEVVQQVEKILATEESVADISSVAGLNFIDNYSQPNSAFLIVSLKPFEERTDPSQTAQAIIARLGGKAARRTGWHRRAAGAASDYRTRHRRRLYLRAAGHARRRPEGAGAGDARPARRCQPGRIAEPGVQHIHRGNAVDLSGYRPGKSIGARAEAQLHFSGFADLARRLLCQRLQPFRPHLAGAAAGGGSRSVLGRRHLSHQRSQRFRRTSPAAQPRSRHVWCWGRRP